MSGLAAGTVVTVREDWPETRGPAHIRTPHYLRGRQGRVLRHLGDFPDPEQLAFGRPAARRALYHVAFALPSLWPEGGRDDELMAELFEHWIDAVPRAAP